MASDDSSRSFQMRNQRNAAKPPAGGTRPSLSDAQLHSPGAVSGERARPRRPPQPVSAKGGSSTTATTAPPQPPPPAAAKQQRSRSPVFWGAKEDAPLYSGPLGEAVGSAPQGCVLLEVSRYRDVFGGWWISTRCADGSLGWIEYREDAYSEDASADGARDATGAVWQRVYDTRATPAPPAAPATAADRGTASHTFDASVPDTTRNWAGTFPLLDVAAVADIEADHFLFQDASLFQYYWENVYNDAEHRDWNGEYQRAVEEYRMAPLLFTSPDTVAASASARVRVLELVEEFRRAVLDAVMRVCAEAVVPLAQRRLHSLPQHPNGVYFVGGLLVKRCVDSANGDLGGDELAAKVGNAIFRNCELLAHESTSHFLYTPLLARCTFSGHSFLCSAIPPYGSDNLVFANVCPANTKRRKKVREDEEVSKTTAAVSSENGAHSDAPFTPPFVLDLLRGLASALRFDDNQVPWEWRVYAGRDRRLYLSHTSRLLPAVLPLAGQKARSVSGSAPPSAEASSNRYGVVVHDEEARLYSALIRSHVRPEVLLCWPTEWCVNECCVSAESEEERHTELALEASVRESSSVAVGEWIKGDGITRAAGVLGFQWPLSAPSMPQVSCNACQNVIEADEIRFVVCASPSQCCRICIQCYMRVVTHDAASPEQAGERLSHTCVEAVQCDGGCRSAGHFLMEPPVDTVLHAHGVNVRYLPYVLHRLPQSTRPAVEHFLQVELVARAAKYVLQEELRRTTTASEARSACETVLSALLQPTGTVSERFWRSRLGPSLQAHFDGICEPFQVSMHALRGVAERVESLTGVWLSEASLASLASLSRPDPVTEQVRPFVEIESIAPRTWVFRVASSHNASSAPPSQEINIEGATASSATPLRRRLEAMLLFWIGHTPDDADDQQQPFYLDDSMFHK